MSQDSFVPRLFKKFNSLFVKTYKGSRISNSNFFKPVESTTFNSSAVNSQDTLYPSKTSNEIFREHIERYPECKKCLQNNGYNLNCLRVGEIGLENCQGENVNYCESCYEECYMFCDPDYGNTDPQYINTTKILNIPPVSDFMGNLYGFTFQNENFWKGHIQLDQTETLNQIFKGFTGAVESQQEISDIYSGGNPGIKVNYAVSVGDYSPSYTNLPPNQQTNFRAADTQSGGGGDDPPPAEDCSVCLNNGGAAASYLYILFTDIQSAI